MILICAKSDADLINFLKLQAVKQSVPGFFWPTRLHKIDLLTCVNLANLAATSFPSLNPSQPGVGTQCILYFVILH